jgi:UDP-hydrolysing UDP-N-acetyl-D-glucosamine 2-epimerase
VRKRVCAVTGSRAEYGLFHPLLELIQADRSCALQVVATGMHLSREHGLTCREIEADGFRVSEKVDIKLGDDSAAGVARSLGLAVIGLGRTFQRLSPDLLILVGDRFETFAAAAAGHLARIPIAHFHGGELTEGALDDAFRHAVTKLSLLHFTAAEPYRRRVIQLGEAPGRVFNIGALSLDNIRGLRLLDRPALERALGSRLGERSLLVTFHPETLGRRPGAEEFKELLRALDAFPDAQVIFTSPNADEGGRRIQAQISAYVRRWPGRAARFVSLGRLRYLSLVRQAGAVVGNSSSGIIEVPALGRPTVNVGNRQGGRLRPASVIDVPAEADAIRRAVAKALSPRFQSLCRRARSPYVQGGGAAAAWRILRRFLARPCGTAKAFHDLKGGA